MQAGEQEGDPGAQDESSTEGAEVDAGEGASDADAGLVLDGKNRAPAVHAEGHELEVTTDVVEELAMDELAYPLASDDPRAALSEADREAFGLDDAQPKAVLNKGTRKVVTNGTKQPFSTVAQLLITFKKPNGTTRATRCTGTLIRADAVLTAAHCLWNPTEGFAYSVRVVPAMTATTKPFGESSGRKLFVPTEYRDPAQTARGRYDYGVIRTWAKLGDRAGTRSIGVHPSPSKQAIRIIGYAGDQPNVMLESTGATDKLSGVQVLHTADSFGGTSGAAITASSGTWANKIFAVHSGQATIAGYNVALVLTSSSYSKLTSWATQAL